MPPESGLLTQLLQMYMSAFSIGIGNITIDAMHMLQLLTFFAIVLYGIGASQGYVDFTDGIFKIIKIGGMIWIVSDYESLVNTLLQGFDYLGTKAGGGTVVVDMNDPSAIAEQGIVLVKPLFEDVTSFSSILNLPGILLSVWSAFWIMLSFYAIGLRMFIAYITFYTTATLGLFFLVGAVLSFTRPVAESVIGMLLREGFKFMVLSFLVSIMQTMVETWALPEKPSIEELSLLMLGTMTMAFIVWYVPGALGNIFSGGSISLTRDKK
jgi:type IV secretory pathway TrbL component